MRINQYPRFLIRVDFMAGAIKNQTLDGIEIIASKGPITEVYKKAEEYIRQRREEIYLVDILERTGKRSQEGDPLYRAVATSSVSKNNTETTWYERAEADKDYVPRKKGWISTGSREQLLA